MCQFKENNNCQIIRIVDAMPPNLKPSCHIGIRIPDTLIGAAAASVNRVIFTEIRITNKDFDFIFAFPINYNSEGRITLITIQRDTNELRFCRVSPLNTISASNNFDSFQLLQSKILHKYNSDSPLVDADGTKTLDSFTLLVAEYCSFCSIPHKITKKTLNLTGSEIKGEDHIYLNHHVYSLSIVNDQVVVFTSQNKLTETLITRDYCERTESSQGNIVFNKFNFKFLIWILDLKDLKLVTKKPLLGSYDTPEGSPRNFISHTNIDDRIHLQMLSGRFKHYFVLKNNVLATLKIDNDTVTLTVQVFVPYGQTIETKNLPLYESLLGPPLSIACTAYGHLHILRQHGLQKVILPINNIL